MAASGGITVLPDLSFLIQIANFILLIIILNLVLYKPIRNVLVQRKEKVQGLEQSIQSSHQDVQEKEGAWNHGIREARSKGLTQKDALIQEALDQEKKIVDEINQKAQADLAKVRGKIEEDIEGVRAALIKEVDGFAGAISQKILGRAVS